ncbi:unnamed protein product [Trichobilharzia szidati]|nr:unnamed protein product [Trichobilharzia szidati]CAH8868103.1 unnamed protein product [Trichobilharzia szidati]
MIFSRLPLIALRNAKFPLRQAHSKSACEKQGVLKWACQNYPVVYLGGLIFGAVSAITLYTIRCLLQNPDLFLPFYDKIPRDEYYFDKHYFGAKQPENMDVLPPVRMHHDGVLEFPYENHSRKYVHPPE